MKVNALIIKEYRTSHAFTQQHLADACDVSLRTIQRVERYGVASSETLMSLSAVFGVDKLELLDQTIDEVISTTEQNPINFFMIITAMVIGLTLGSVTTYLLLQ